MSDDMHLQAHQDITERLARIEAAMLNITRLEGRVIGISSAISATVGLLLAFVK